MLNPFRVLGAAQYSHHHYPCNTVVLKKGKDEGLLNRSLAKPIVAKFRYDGLVRPEVNTMRQQLELPASKRKLENEWVLPIH